MGSPTYLLSSFLFHPYQDTTPTHPSSGRTSSSKVQTSRTKKVTATTAIARPDLRRSATSTTTTTIAAAHARSTSPSCLSSPPPASSLRATTLLNRVASRSRSNSYRGSLPTTTVLNEKTNCELSENYISSVSPSPTTTTASWEEEVQYWFGSQKSAGPKDGYVSFPDFDHFSSPSLSTLNSSPDAE